ncbi:MAG: DNA adenine methylase [Bacteroidota bacterium]
MEPQIILPKQTYFGGKGAAGVVHRIINQMPKHQVFVSGFLGLCAVLRYKRPAARNIGFDLDPEVIEVWNKAKFSNDIAPPELAILQASFLNVDVPELLDPHTFIYLDPPYLHETRTSNTRYRFELTDQEHRALLDKAKGLPCMVAISCYDSSLYRVALDGWRKIQFPAQSRGGLRTETLYMNYPEPAPDALHDARFVGDNFRQREKSKRRIETILRKIKNLSPTERAALIERLPNLAASPDLNPNKRKGYRVPVGTEGEQSKLF